MKKLLLLLLLFLSIIFESKSQFIHETEKIFGLSEIWRDTKNNFIFYDNIKLDWDSLYVSYIDKVKYTKNVKDYYDTLKKFTSYLNDSHSGILYPDSIWENCNRVPIRTQLIDGKVIVTNVLNDTLFQNGINIGMELVRINEIDVIEYANKNIAPLISSSTSQDKQNRIFNYELLIFEKHKNIKIELKSINGNTRSFYLSNMSRKKEKLYDFKILDNNVGLLIINSFSNPEFYSFFDSIYPSLLKTSSLIIDIRNNGGGNDNQGEYILKHLVNKPFYSAKTRMIQYNSYYNGAKDFPISKIENASWIIEPNNNKTTYTKKVVLLISEKTFSAAENFAMEFDYIKRGVLIGRKTAGSTGMPKFTELPYGGYFRVCTKEDLYPNDKKFVGIGIIPNIEILQNRNSIIHGIDQEIINSLKYLNK
jgi:C-terminal processing protease CtpA/Prc